MKPSLVVEGSSGRAGRTEGSQRVLPKDASENACKTRGLGQKHTSACKLSVRRARVQYGVESGFRVHESIPENSQLQDSSGAARADVFEKGRETLSESHITHTIALYSRTRSRR